MIWATQKIQELEATLYNALQQDPGRRASEALSEGQREDLQAAVEKVRRQILRQSREFDSQVLRERMELLQQAQQVRGRWLAPGAPCPLPSLWPLRRAPGCSRRVGWTAGSEASFRAVRRVLPTWQVHSWQSGARSANRFPDAR